jgi:hypothetical protein
MYPRIPWELVAVLLGSAKHTSETTALYSYSIHLSSGPISKLLISSVNVTLRGSTRFLEFGDVLLGTHQLVSHLSCVERDTFSCFLNAFAELRNAAFNLDCLTACPSATYRLPLIGFSPYFLFEVFSKICGENSSNMTRITATLY